MRLCVGLCAWKRLEGTDREEAARVAAAPALRQQGRCAAGQRDGFHGGGDAAAPRLCQPHADDAAAVRPTPAAAEGAFLTAGAAPLTRAILTEVAELGIVRWRHRRRAVR